MKYTLVQHSLMPTEKALASGDRILNCPFQAPVIIPGAIHGQGKAVPIGCGTWCVLFELHNNVVKLHCSTDMKALIEPEKPSVLHKA